MKQPQFRFLFFITLAGWLTWPSLCHAWQSNESWARWRGANGNGIAAPDQKPPVRWGDDGQPTNVIWKTKVPGRGHASPIVLGDQIFLATSEQDSQTQSVLAYDRKTGKALWKTEINRGGLADRIHPNNTHASSTIATDGKSVFAVFNHHGGVTVTSLSLDGEKQWERNVGPYQPKYPFGFGASPIVHEDKLIVSNENLAQGGLTAYNVTTGEPVWKIEREGVSSYSTPVVANVAGREQLLISGGKSVTSYDPKTGQKNWSAPANWFVTCATLVWDDDVVYASGGFPAAQTLAIDAGTGKILWTNGVKSYEQSMIALKGYLYTLSDNGVIFCWRGRDGQEMWSQRFVRGASASPVFANGNLYFTAENGRSVVLKATHEGYQEVARNRLGDRAFASFAIVGDQIFTRVAKEGQEYLYCLGE